MKIYADILFFMNFYADFLCLSLSSQFLRKKVLVIRKIFGAVLGGIFGVLAFLPDLEFLKSFFLSLAIGVLMGFVTFFPCGMKEFLKGIFLMYFFSVIFSGILMFCVWNIGGGVVKNGVFYTKEIAVFPILFVTYKAITMLKTFFVKRAKEKICHVKICYKGKTVTADGFCDTGNGLFDPVTKKDVLMIDEVLLKKLVSDECTEKNLCEWIDEGIKVIPYKTITESGILYGFSADYVIIDSKKFEKAVLCVSREELKYPVILPAGV